MAKDENMYIQTNSTIVTRLLDRGSIPGKNRHLSSKCPGAFSSQPVLLSYSCKEGKGGVSM
jgi:hypothetical protein